MSETRISEKPGVLCPCQTDLGGRARVLEAPPGARPGWGSEATGRQARVKSAAGQARPPGPPSGTRPSALSPSAAPGQVGPGRPPLCGVWSVF